MNIQETENNQERADGHVQMSRKLLLWQDRLKQSDTSYDKERNKMDHREDLYNGIHKMKQITEGDMPDDQHTTAPQHVRNIIFENIESMVSSSIPQPKVTALHKEDEHLADVIEHYLRNELDRMPFENINDMQERTVPIQGGAIFWMEWDNSRRTHTTVGENTVTPVHPKQLAPQPAVFTGIDDMDWVILNIPTTKNAVKRKYGIEVTFENESNPEVRTTDNNQEFSEDAVTMHVGYARNDSGGIDKYTWVNDTEIEDLEDYQARRQPVCRKCRKVRPLRGQIISTTQSIMPVPTMTEEPGLSALLPGSPQMTEGIAPEDQLEAALAAALTPDPAELMAQRLASDFLGQNQSGILGNVQVQAGEEPKPERYNGGPCPWCGSEDWTTETMEFEEVMLPITNASGLTIPGATPGIEDETGAPVMRPTLIPFYKPDCYPVVLQRSVSIYGQLLGNSDVDVIEDQQNTVNRMEQKIIDRLLKAGSRVTLPEGNFRIDSKDYEKWYIKNPSEKALIDIYTFSGNIQYELMYLANVYEESRQILGITDSFQGRKDATATSAVAKQFAAAQSAGRLESKRVMKDAAYAKIFEMLFKFALAYSDEPRTVTYKNSEGETEYEEFNRYDFLKQDADGQYYWNDQFLFSCDTAAPLATNREALWQETRMNLQSGAFGNPTATETLIIFWSKMEELHYPGAGQTKKYLEEQRQREQEMQERILQMQMQQGVVPQQQNNAQYKYYAEPAAL